MANTARQASRNCDSRTSGSLAEITDIVGLAASIIELHRC
jgi:hypothetical protein